MKTLGGTVGLRLKMPLIDLKEVITCIAFFTASSERKKMPLSLYFFFFIGGVLSVASAQVFPFPTCNVGPMHHGHIILPLGVSTVEECKTSTTQFLLSHGATFFCPHTWDIKLLASVADDAARNALCTSYYNALAAKESPIHLFRPTLAQGGLPAEVREKT